MKLGIIGCGMIVNELLPHLADWGIGVRALCVTERSLEKGRELAQRYGIPAVYTGLDLMLADPAVDTVYVAANNVSHFSLTRQVLEAGRNAVVEKPFTVRAEEAQALADFAVKKGLFLFEAMPILYQKNYAKLREWLPRIGQVRMVYSNYSQYSRRYDRFLGGETPAVFDPAMAGGALMDLNVYNLHWITGLFGMPERAEYRANMMRGIDTSGIVTLDYPDLGAAAIAAKDCAAPNAHILQGTKGYIEQEGPGNTCGTLRLHLNDGTEGTFSGNADFRMEEEFRTFARQIDSGDTAECYRMLEHSVRVMRLMEDVRIRAGIRFPMDQ